MNFDLISDLHIDDQDTDWSWNQAQSPVCVVAGDVARDRDTLRRCLSHLGQQYQAVLYIDGNDEHRYSFRDLSQSYEDLKTQLRDIPNVVYLQDQMAVLNDVAFVGANHWWTFDLSDRFSELDTMRFMSEYYDIEMSDVAAVRAWAQNDTRYLAASVRRLQVHLDVRRVVLVTHSVPRGDLVLGDHELAENIRINTTVNQASQDVLDQDTENKIAVWCFGHYHRAVDTTVDGVRYVSNPQGRPGTPWCQEPYLPIQIQV